MTWRDVRPGRWLVAAWLLAAVAYAQPEARALYDQGAYAAAFEAVRSVDTVPAQLLAARAAIAHALYGGVGGDEARAWLERALVAADRALEQGSDRPDVLLAKAQARGELALRSSALGNLNVAGAIRDLLERAYELAPDDPDARVALGMWHVELVARGVGWLYGADASEGLALVTSGVDAAPRRIDLRVEYAAALASVGRRDDAREQIEIALALPARDAFDRHQHARAEALRASWE